MLHVVLNAIVWRIVVLLTRLFIFPCLLVDLLPYWRNNIFLGSCPFYHTVRLPHSLCIGGWVVHYKKREMRVSYCILSCHLVHRLWTADRTVNCKHCKHDWYCYWWWRWWCELVWRHCFSSSASSHQHGSLLNEASILAFCDIFYNIDLSQLSV